MVNIPVRFKRMAAAFDEASGKVRSCDESSGSEHSADLSDLVNSFLERDIRERRESEEEIDFDIERNEMDDEESEMNSPEFEDFRDSLKNLFDLENDSVKKSVHSEVEKALREVGSDLSDFKRRLMARLRIRGLDAGLCKSKWEKTGRCPTGDYEYIDVNAGETRYIIEVNLSGEFTIARPTNSYASLLDVFPLIFVGKPDEMKQVVRKMSTAIRTSMKRVGIHVPPWRRQAYMQAKWFGSYKRTTNQVSNRKAAFGLGQAENRAVGFVPMVQQISFKCREDFVTRGGVRVGNLAAALNLQKEMLL